MKTSICYTHPKNSPLFEINQQVELNFRSKMSDLTFTEILNVKNIELIGFPSVSYIETQEVKMTETHRVTFEMCLETYINNGTRNIQKALEVYIHRNECSIARI